MGRHEDGNTPHYGTHHDSSLNSSNSMDTEVKNPAFSEEFDRERENISQGISVWNRGKSIVELDNTTHDLHNTQKSIDSTLPIDSNEMNLVRIARESPGLRTEIRATSSQSCNVLSTGVYTPVDKEHPTEISSKRDGGIAGGEKSNVREAQYTGNHGKWGLTFSLFTFT